LEQEARRLGSDRVLLTVWMDNPGAIALYSALGYTAQNMNMVRRLSAPG
jgi:ribosomal protein S18 acetylase RimI-like enzyme